MKISLLLALAFFISQCKTTSMNRRNTSEGQIRDPVVPAAAPVETVEKEQSVTIEDIQNAPSIKVEEVAAPPVMVPEIGSQCKAPVSASCLNLVLSAGVETPGEATLGAALKKYGRAITAEQHACNYYKRNFSTLPNITYFVDAVVYWADSGNKIRYRAYPMNFIFSAGCSMDQDFKNPFAAELKREQAWDGTSTLQSLGYRFGALQKLPASFAADQLKAEKLSQAYHKCDWATRPLIYAFPDGVIYQLVGGTTINVYPYNQIKAMNCLFPLKLAMAAENLFLTCGKTDVNADPAQRQTLADLSLLPATFVHKNLDKILLNQLETNGKPVAKASLDCIFAVRNRILQFGDGFAFIDDYCADVNIYTTQYVKDMGCKVAAP